MAETPRVNGDCQRDLSSLILPIVRPPSSVLRSGEMVHANPKFPIVGIGASAGGIPAMEGFFQGLPERCGMAFVVVTHLNPDRESRLHEVIARYTDMEVVLAADKLKVVSETVYVMPENVVLSLHDGVLSVKP